MAAFEAKTVTTGDRTVVTLTGECDLAVREELTTVLLTAVDAAGCVVLDLAGLRFMDSSGIHALVTGHQAAVRQGHRLYVRGAVGAVARVLDLTGLADLLALPVERPERDLPDERPERTSPDERPERAVDSPAHG
ncbi:STAS domain-containing protein [Plantactinospora sp. KBS50]|uniref:STAS domain-containing protein n=1 Tax=Plantactinospora sp. KBS50 TaxID=2024580 RepID=UPI000BAB0AE4|nr:STAS domain-containing protein [Plantactinospora sp. KBS50]ASW55233.1 hypothetical protein CIK06_15200 [Plantactinospora sp. KBS50]